MNDERIAILMATYGGQIFLREQIDTLIGQTVPRLDVWVSDDGSTDGTLAILEDVAASWPKGEFHIAAGPRAGFAENFRSLLTNPAVDADYVAFCDQDDRWDSDKLEAALAWLATQDPTRPALYCTRTRTMTIDGKDAGFSPLFAKPPSFHNAIVQSIAGANTMVLNRAAHRLMREASRRSGFVSHDWWCYLMVSGAGGAVHYSPAAKIGYRQHSGNLVGENNSWRARMSRFGHLVRGRFVNWNMRNLAGLQACEDLLTADARETIRLFSQAREAAFPARLTALIRARLYRQTLFGQFGLYLACVMRWL